MQEVPKKDRKQNSVVDDDVDVFTLVDDEVTRESAIVTNDRVKIELWDP